MASFFKKIFAPIEKLKSGLAKTRKKIASSFGGLFRMFDKVDEDALEQLEEAIHAGAGRALLDNMSPGQLHEAVVHAAGRIVLEASGGMRLGQLRVVAETGVDCISLGCLTHSAPAADLAMETESIRVGDS